MADLVKIERIVNQELFDSIFREYNNGRVRAPIRID